MNSQLLFTKRADETDEQYAERERAYFAQVQAAERALLAARAVARRDPVEEEREESRP